MAESIEPVNLSTFWSMYNDIETEYAQLRNYQQMGQFWTAYLNNLNGSAQQVRVTTANLATSWPGPSQASQAFQDSMAQGQSSLEAQAQAVSAVPQQLEQASGMLGASHQVAQTQKSQLLTLKKSQAPSAALQSGPSTPTEGAPIQATDTGEVLVDETTAGKIASITAALQTAHDQLAQSLAQAASTMQGIPDPQWKGPGAATGAAAGQGSGGAKQASTGAGGSGSGSTGDSASAGGDSSAAGDSSTGDGTDSSTGDSSTAPGLGDTSSLPSSSPDPVTPLPDPTLAGSATPTLPPSTTPNLTSIPTPAPITTSSSSHPLSFAPLPSFSPPPKVASAPIPVSETGAPIADTAPAVAAEESMATGAATTSSTGSGLYPPMMPPMSPGGAGSGGVQPGEADGAGGPAIRWQGRDSTRAGLVPELQGRGGTDEESGEEPHSRGGDVLDEELWQVSAFASPVTPPGLDPRRGRSRGY
ncbi:MAG TPA: hypothetical protein VGJ45_32820 [Pseudonocardiaceae bacterium]